MTKPNVLIRSKKNRAMELFNNNQLREADTFFAGICQAAPADVDSFVMRGLIHRKLGLFKDAEVYCNRALKLKPDYSWAHHVLGSVQQCQGRMNEALASYQKSIRLQPDFVEAHYFLANALRETGAIHDAVVSYRKAIKLQPDHVEALSNLGATLIALGDTQEATQVLNKAITLRPDTPQILCNLATILERNGQLDEALEKYNRALILSPDSLDAVTHVAALLEKTNRLSDAQNMVDHQLQRFPDNPDLMFVAARLARRANKLDDAILLLERALPLTSALDNRGAMHILLGQLFDRKNDSDRAYTHLVEGNRLSAQALGSVPGDRWRYLKRVERMQSYLTQDLAAIPAAELSSRDMPTPAFLLGFPRSGTTLLEQILDSHPSIQSMEEKPTVSVMAEAFEEMGKGHANALAALTDDQVGQLRSIYFAEMARHIKPHPGSLLIDKNPLNTVNVHLIWRVFPQAKFILALRHPCDACFSCFMQNFVLNEANTGFNTLESSADIYAHVMRTWIEAARILPLDYHQVRYEDLVADFENETRALLNFLGVGWDQSVLNHTEHAAKRGTINTPSYHQVTQPIYQHAKYRWKRYAVQFEPVLSSLQPYIEYFGYSGGASLASQTS